MTYLISRANYERCTEGMTDTQRADFDRDFMRYPERLDSPDGRIDVDRVADAYATLRAREMGMPPQLTFEAVRERVPFARWGLTTTTAPYETAWWHCPKGNGKSSWRPPAPWEEIGDGVYAAPTGTPMPFFTPDPGPAPTIEEQAEQQQRWPYGPGHRLLDDLIPAGDLNGRWLPDETPHRYFLNQWVEAPPPADPLADLLAWMRRYTLRAARPPRAKRIACGKVVIGALRLVGRSATLAAAGSAIDLAGIPVVPDPDLPEDVWQLVDAETNEVLDEGHVGSHLVELMRVMRETIDDLADRTGVPRDLFYD